MLGLVSAGQNLIKLKVELLKRYKHKIDYKFCHWIFEYVSV